MEKRQNTYYQSLYELAAILNSTRSPDDILHAIVEGITKEMGAKGCSLMLLTPDGKVLLHTAACGLSDWFVRKGPVSADRSMSEALRGEPVAVLDAATDDRIEYKKQIKREGIASVLSIPVRLKGAIIGVMRVYTASRRRFSDDEISFATAAANFGAIALESAHFYETFKMDYESLRQEIRQQQSELGNEWIAEPPVVPSAEPGPVAPPGG